MLVEPPIEPWPCIIGVSMQTKVLRTRSAELGWGIAVCPDVAPDVLGGVASASPVGVLSPVSAGGSAAVCGACAPLPDLSEPPHPTAAAKTATPHRAPTFRMTISSGTGSGL